MKNLKSLKRIRLKATDMTLRLPRPGLQYILSDASYYVAGFVLMVEDYF